MFSWCESDAELGFQRTRFMITSSLPKTFSVCTTSTSLVRQERVLERRQLSLEDELLPATLHYLSRRLEDPSL